MSVNSLAIPLTSITGIRYGREDRPTLVLDLLGPYPLPDTPAADGDSGDRPRLG